MIRLLCSGFLYLNVGVVHAVQMLINSIPPPPRWGEAKFDNLVLFSPQIEVPVDEVLTFMEKGGNVLVVTDKEPNDSIRKLLSASGLDVEPASVVFDSSSRIPNELLLGSRAPHDAFYARNVIKNEYLLPKLGADNVVIAYS